MSSANRSLVEDSLTMDNASTISSVNIKEGKIKSNNTNVVAKDKRKITSSVNIDDFTQNIVQGKLTIKHAFGCNLTAIDGIQSYSSISTGEKDGSDRLIMKVGNQVTVIDIETLAQKHLVGQSRAIRNISHVSISENRKYLSVCESTRTEKYGPGDAQVSIYHLNNLTKMKTLTYPSNGDFVYSEFSTGDSKHLYGFINESSESNVVIWLWEKEKIFKVVSIPISIKRIRVCTLSISTMFSASGPGHLKLWYFGIDSTFKHINLLPSSKGSECNVIDQAWLKSHVQIHKLASLVDLETSSSHGSLTESHSKGMNKTSESTPKRQCIYIHEGQESAIASPPITLELRQTIFLKPIAVGSIVSNATALVTYSKGFLLLGSVAIVSVYDRTEEKRDPYIEVKRVSLGNFSIFSACMLPAEDKFTVIGSNGRLLSVALDASFEVVNSKGSAAIPNQQSIGGIQGSAMANELSSIIAKYHEEHRKTEEVDHNNSEKMIINSGAIDLLSGGFHGEPIISTDIAYDRAIVATISSNRICRIWNYETLKVELIHNFKDDEPLCCTLNNTGYQILVSFLDRVILYNLLHNKLFFHKEVIQKSCKVVKFSNGNQYWAGASGLNVVVYETKTFIQLHTFQGHMNMVRSLTWAPGDQVLFSTGTEGNLFGWCIANPSMRLDVISANNRTSMIIALEIDSNNTAFPPSVKDIDESDTDYKAPVRNAIVSYQDTDMKIIPWKYEMSSKSNSSYHSGNYSIGKTDLDVTSIPGDKKTLITCLCLSYDKKYLFAGTSNGNIRIYPWPAPTAHSAKAIYPVGTDRDLDYGELFVELGVHDGAVTAVKMSPMGDAIISTGEDGSLFVISFTPLISTTNDNTIMTSETNDLKDLTDEKDYTSFQFNRDILCIGKKELNSHFKEVKSMQNLLEYMKNTAVTVFNQKQNQFRDELQKIYDHQEKKVAAETDKFNNLKSDFQTHSEYLYKSMANKDAVYVEMMKELENRYERKLEDQLLRYDNLNEEMEALKQKFESLMNSEREEFSKQLNSLKISAKSKEKRLKTENKRFLEDKSADETSFKVILNEQEQEYEDELRQLIGAAESEMSKERDTVSKLKVLVHNKNERLDMLKKKLIEVNNIAKARQALLQNEIQQKQQLASTIEHYKKNLQERETAISEKDKTIIELTSTTRTLENFRFVLDHRLQQLSSERGPIMDHIEGLERHIGTMYEELVEEFDLKKSVAENLHLTETKVKHQEKDIARIKSEIKVKDEYIINFKRDIDNIMQAKIEGKQLEEAVNCVYRKYIRNEPIENVVKANDIVKNICDELIHNPYGFEPQKGSEIADDDNEEEGTQNKGKLGDLTNVSHQVSHEIVDTAKESDQQKIFKEQEVMNLKAKISNKKVDAHNLSRKSMYDNSNLLYDSAMMQKTIKSMEKELANVREQLLMINKQLSVKRAEEEALRSAYRTDRVMHHKQVKPPQQNTNSNDSAARLSSVNFQQQSAVEQSEFETLTKPSLSRFKIDLDLRSTDLTAITDKLSGLDTAHVDDGLNSTIDSSRIKKFNPKSESLINFSLATDKIDSVDNNRTKGNQLIDKNVDSDQAKIISVKMNRGNSANSILDRPTSGNHANNFIQRSATAHLLPNIPRPDSRGQLTKPKSAAARPSDAKASQQIQVAALQKKSEDLEQMLDTLSREKDMQRLEITRVRKEIAQKSMLLNKLKAGKVVNINHLTPVMGSLSYSQSTLHAGSAIPPDYTFEEHSESSSKNQLGTNSGSKFKVNRSLTSADREGKPSEDDLKRMILAPKNANLA